MDIQETDTSVCVSVKCDTPREFINTVNLTYQNMLHSVIQSMIRHAVIKGANKSSIVVTLSFTLNTLLDMECYNYLTSYRSLPRGYVENDYGRSIFFGPIKFEVDKNDQGFSITVTGTKEK